MPDPKPAPASRIEDAGPQRILDTDGFARSFVLTRPLQDVDIADARIRSGPFTLPPALARTRLKEWQHFCFVSDEWIVTLAVVTIQYMKVAWLQTVNIATGERFEHHRQTPVADVRIARSLWDDHTHFRAAGFWIGIHSHLDQRRHVIDVDIDATSDAPAMRGTWTAHHDPAAISPLVVSLPLGRQRALYSHKVPLPVAGALTIGNTSATFDSANAVAILDVHKAHYPRRMFWNWATCAGRDADGKILAFNLTKNVIQDDVSWNENCVWIDGEVHRVGPAVFEFDANKPKQAWHIRSADDAIEVRFTPLGGRSENTSVPGVAKSRFEQLYGRFEGRVLVGGKRHEISGFLGLCEDHESVW